MLVIIYVLIYILKTSIYDMAYWIGYEERVKKYGYILIMGVVYTIIVAKYCQTKLPLVNVLTEWSVLLTLTVRQYKGAIKKLSRMLVLCFAMTLLEECTGNVLDVMTESHSSDFRCEIITETIVIFMIITMVSLLKKYNTFCIRVELRKRLDKIAVPLGAGFGISILFIISGLDYAKKRINNPLYDKMVTYGGIVAYLGVAFIWYLVCRNRKINRVLEEQLQREQALTEYQKKYYESLLEKEETTKKYRHDRAKHLLCLQELCENRKYEDLRNYIRGLTEEQRKLVVNEYHTGNYVVDILTQHYLNLLPDHSEKEVHGVIGEMEKNNILTVIYGNLLENAIEAATKCKTPKVKIYLNQGETYIQMKVENSHSLTGNGDFIQTSKPNKSDHGYGIKNIRDILRNIDGNIEINQSEQWVSISVIIPRMTI